MNKTVIIKNNTNEVQIIEDLLSFNITASGIVTLSDYFTSTEISDSNSLIQNISNETFTINNGIEDLDITDGIKYCTTTLHEVNIHGEYRDKSGKLRVHQTCKPEGRVNSWTSTGDDLSNHEDIGGGNTISFKHVTGSGIEDTKYIDFNIIDNDTWINEGYLMWEGAKLDSVNMDLVTTTAVTTTYSGTSYSLYNNKVIIPAASGTGNIKILSDLTTSSGGLVYFPLNEQGYRCPAFWNAEWDSDNKIFTNITPAPLGDGEYNIFSEEMLMRTFVRNIVLIGSSSIRINSNDTEQIGHGMRLKITYKTNTTDYSDHEWAVSCFLCLHREASCVMG
jgi:hypothetical protein